MTASQELFHVSARNVRPMVLSAEDSAQLESIAKLGIVGFDRMTSGTAMDAIQSSITTASITTPVQFLQTFMPGLVKVLTAARKIDEIVGVTTIGSFEDEEVVQGILENTGGASVYGDYTALPYASWNVNFERRTIVRFEQGMRVGQLEEMRAAKIKVSSADSKRESAALQLEIRRNSVGFSGYNGGNNRTYGVLNDPNLPAYVTVATGVGGVTWALKTFLEITADIRTAIQALRTQSQDTIDPETTPITLAIATAAVDMLSKTSDFGISVRDWLTKTYPKVRVVSAPQFNAANGGANVFYLFAEQISDTSTDDGRVFLQACPTKFMLRGVAKQVKGYEEGYSNATAGVFCKRPWAIVRRSGI